MQITTVGLDLAKNVFQVHGVNGHGKVVFRKQLQRDQVAAFFANLPACAYFSPSWTAWTASSSMAG